MAGPVLLATVIIVLSSHAKGRVTIITKEKTCWDGSQKDYRGATKETISRQSCMKWTEQTPHGHNMTEDKYPESGLGDHNFCRNPDNNPGGAWCYTTNPLQKWDFCPVRRCSGFSYCWDGLQNDYRGPLQVTKSRRQCQKWTEQYPQEHNQTSDNYPGVGLGDHNYCRNPSNDPGGAWCFTTDPEKRWDYCDVPKCSLPFSKRDCWDANQMDYRGEIQETRSGEKCMKWTEQSPHKHSFTEKKYPHVGLGDHNFCRNPSNNLGGSWCYTTNPLQRWDFCHVPKCLGPENCWDDIQNEYRGPLQVTKSGLQCQKWTEQYPQEHSRTPENYPEAGLGDHNYCRNPDNWQDGAWCYTTNPDKRWELCDVPTCLPPLFARDCWDNLQSIGYRGHMNVTVLGKSCMKWNENNPHKKTYTAEKYPNGGLGDHNFCRNPDGWPGGAWCYTTDPLQRWDHCPLPKCAGFSYCWESLQNDYRGPQQVTKSGEQCQKWTEQYPQQHSRTPENYPGIGLGDHNYCRNPDNEPEVWCYTTNPEKRWEHCDVPKCSPPQSKRECWDDTQMDYRGEINETLSGESCMMWTDQSPHEHSRTPENYPDGGLGEHNFCRNPDSWPGGAWCYTTNPLQRWDYCPIPKCSGSKNCWDGLQKEYRGPLHVTKSGLQCQKWSEQYPQKHSRNPENYPGTGLGDHNYCRNPDNWQEGTWCYTTNPDKRWELCDVPRCSPTVY